MITDENENLAPGPVKEPYKSVLVKSPVSDIAKPASEEKALQERSLDTVTKVDPIVPPFIPNVGAGAVPTKNISDVTTPNVPDLSQNKEGVKDVVILGDNNPISVPNTIAGADDAISKQLSVYETELRAADAKRVALKRERDAEVEKKMELPLHFDEKRIDELDGGYFFTKGDDGIVRYRSADDHRAQLESRYFVEPDRAPQQQVIAKIF